MPLPTDENTPWPPNQWAPVARDIYEAAIWYAGDEKALAGFYGNQGGATRPSDKTAGTGLLQRAKFWARRQDDQHTPRQRIHIPAAPDVAATAADLLFGDEARFVIPEAHEFTDGSDQADAAAVATEDRLTELADLDGWASTLLEAAEVASALGDVYLRPVWDLEIAGHPMLTVVHPDHAVPEFRYNTLTAVTFWRVVETDGSGKVIRHLERHERGVILHGLYIGTERALGRQVPLDLHTDTAGLADQVPLPDGIDLVVRHIPNVRPNRRHRGLPIGRSDLDQTWPLMDALDETWTSWMRDIRLGKGRVIVADQFLDTRGRGTGAVFDMDAEVFSPLNMDPANMENAGITVAQFAIRTEEHARTCAELFQRIVVTAGYSPQSFGMQGDGAEQTATEVDAREGRSDRTTARKQRYVRRKAEDIAEMMLIIDATVFGSGVEPMRPRLEFPDPDQNDPREIGSTLNLVTLARAASTETKVRMLHPEWEEPQVQAETKRILEEEGLGAVPDPTGGVV